MPDGGEPQLLFLRDLADVEPPRDRYAFYDEEDIYRLVPRPQWSGLEDELWTPRSQEHDPQLEKVRTCARRARLTLALSLSPSPRSALAHAERARRHRRRSRPS